MIACNFLQSFKQKFCSVGLEKPHSQPFIKHYPSSVAHSHFDLLSNYDKHVALGRVLSHPRSREVYNVLGLEKGRLHRM